MTHTSRIPVDAELERQFANARTEGGVRFIKVVISNESLLAVDSHSLSSSLEDDWNAMDNLLEPKKACYILFRLDSTNATGFEWLLVSYVPDGSPVKDRMLYASTRDPLKKQLGAPYFADTLHGSDKSDFTYEAYLDHKNKFAAPPPLTATEITIKNESTAQIEQGVAKEYVHSVQFPLSQDAQNALSNFGSGSVNFVQLKVDATKETIELANSKNLSSINDLQGQFAASEPRFTFFKYDHQHEGEQFGSNLFVYSCPPSSPVKLKMLYSTVKSVVSGAAEQASIEIERSGKIEITELEEFTVQDVNDQLHPKVEKVEAFRRPLRPGRGKPRLMRTGK
eukprot:TRINITY_DN3574_c0_g1_i1.p1 TRINITY_DN3574_c0_g1~~TRINITY_DN3574_c0_g1_i1.p1  ORF type:complete len:338 (-),score=79.52 TRINITY_DN3574_c0_g1_i1:62-1075(-)